MVTTKDIIIEVKSNLREVSKEAKALFGKGGYTQEQFEQWQADDTMPKDLNYLGYVCTGIQTDIHGDQYTTVRIDDYFLEALQTYGETAHAKFVQEYTVDITEVDYTVEVPVYDELGEQVGVEKEIRTKIVRTPTFAIEVDDFDIDGNKVGTKMQPVGGIA